jgi:hypothetical protein
MEEPVDMLQSYLTERLSLNKERKILVLERYEIIDTKAYIDCVSRLETVRVRLKIIEREIRRLTIELRSIKPIKCNNLVFAGDMVKDSEELLHVFILFVFFLVVTSSFPWKRLYLHYF